MEKLYVPDKKTELCYAVNNTWCTLKRWMLGYFSVRYFMLNLTNLPEALIIKVFVSKRVWLLRIKATPLWQSKKRQQAFLSYENLGIIFLCNNCCDQRHCLLNCTASKDKTQSGLSGRTALQTESSSYPVL